MDLQVVMHGLTGRTPWTYRSYSIDYRWYSMGLQIILHGLTGHTLWTYRPKLWTYKSKSMDLQVILYGQVAVHVRITLVMGQCAQARFPMHKVMPCR